MVIRLYDDVEVAAPARTDCPACCGNGVLYVEHNFGCNAAEPYVTRDCGPCGGAGLVDAEWVLSCGQPGCGQPFWRGTGCEHGMDSPLCPDHAPARCTECIDDRGGLDR